jgi:hypothetical protein
MHKEVSRDLSYQVVVVWLQSFGTVGEVSPERSQAVPFAVEEMRPDRETPHFVAV